MAGLAPPGAWQQGAPAPSVHVQMAMVAPGQAHAAAQPGLGAPPGFPLPVPAALPGFPAAGFPGAPVQGWLPGVVPVGAPLLGAALEPAPPGAPPGAPPQRLPQVALVPHLPPPGLPGLPAPAVPGGGEGLWAPALLQAGPGRPPPPPVPAAAGGAGQPQAPGAAAAPQPPLQHAGPAQPEAPASEGEGATPPEVKRCHLHKKPNKACKFCQRFSQAQSAATQAAPQTAAAKTGAGGASEESGKPTFSCSPMLKDQILKSSYFKSLLDNAGTVDALAEEISGFADDLDVYQAGSTTSPSVFFCCVFRLFTLEHTVEELHWLLDHSESVPVRCAACLFARFSLRPDRLWDTLEEYMLDDQDLGDFRVKQPSLPPTVGEYVESLLTKDKYFGTPLPRLPVVVRRKLEEHLAPLSQYRKRAQANQHEMRLFQKPGTPVEVCHRGEWVGGRVTGLMGNIKSRVKVGVELEGGGELAAHLGTVILRDARPRGRSASRSRSRGRQSGGPDWSRWRGESDASMVQRLREQARDDAVCGNSKDYARRPMGFEAGLCVRREQGNAESRLIEEETFQPGVLRPHRSKEEDEDRERQPLWRTEEEQQRQRNLAQIYEKYGGGSGATGGSCRRPEDTEGPDVMRLG